MTRAPESLTGTPDRVPTGEARLDVLADVLGALRLTAGVFFCARLSDPWALLSPPCDELAPVLGSPPECIALFHVLVDGHCQVRLAGDGTTVSMSSGDIIVLPHGDPHVMCSDVGVPARRLDEVLPPRPWNGIPSLEHGGAGAVSRFVCGFLQCDRQFGPLAGALPRLLCARSAGSPAPSARRARRSPNASSASSASRRCSI